MQFGENHAIEYVWAKNELEELITQFNFQLVRTSYLNNLKEQYEKILKLIFLAENDKTHTLKIEYVKVIFKLIGYTRDIISGKGEYKLAYMLISDLYNFSNKYSDKVDKVDKSKIEKMCKEAIKMLVFDNGEHPYGSYKDLKYFCNSHLTTSYERINYNNLNKKDILIEEVVEIICERLKEDEASPNKSLLAKWIPREKSKKFGWITSIIAKKYYSEWFDKYIIMSQAQYKAALRKALTHFRQLISILNKTINTVQINQCENDLMNIDFEKNVTGITLRRQAKALNIIDKKNKSQLNWTKEQSSTWEYNYEKHKNDYLEQCRNGTKIVKGKRVSLVELVRDAFKHLSSYSKSMDERDLLNMQWNENSKQNKSFGNVIVMIDTSGSMEIENCVPLYSAIGLGLRIAEKSKLGKRIITFNTQPEWVNLEGLEFVSMVEKIKKAGCGMNTNFDAALDMILNTAIKNNITPFDMQNFTLIICSCMQIDGCITDYSGTMFDRMEKKYAEAGINSIYKTPYKLPHIVFWNLRSTTGFPSVSCAKNTSMLSGNSPVLLNIISENGCEILKNLTPWKVLMNELNNKRYNKLENIIIEMWG